MRWLAALVVAVLALSIGARRITAAPVDRDGTQSVLMAVNLAHHGTISLAEAPPYLPSDYREPIPVILSALQIDLMDRVLGPAPTEDYFGGRRLEFLKYQNLLWLFLLGSGVFVAIQLGTRSFYVSLVGAALAGFAYGATFWGAEMLDDLATDLAGGAVLVLASAFLAAALTRGRPALCVLAGVSFGVLTLVKAAVLYVFIGVIGTLFLIYLIWRTPLAARRFERDLVIVTLAFVVVLLPWIARNRLELGTFQVSQRAGIVLMTRAVKDQMTPEEYLGSFYVWAPQKLQGPIGSMLGFTRRDLQRGGRLQHLNRNENSDFFKSDILAERAGRPQDAVAYYRRARAERVRLEKDLAAAGFADPEIEADRLLQKRAMGMIEAHPAKHLATTIPFLWRGATLAFPMLIAAMGLAIRYRRYECALMAFPAFGLVMFYALLSHFIPRYSLPVRPVLIALAVIATKLAWDSVRTRTSSARESPVPLRKQQG